MCVFPDEGKADHVSGDDSATARTLNRNTSLARKLPSHSARELSVESLLSAGFECYGLTPSLSQCMSQIT